MTIKKGDTRFFEGMSDADFQKALKDLDAEGGHTRTHAAIHGRHITKETAGSPMKKRLFLAFEGVKDAIKSGSVDAHVRLSHPDRDVCNVLHSAGYEGFAYWDSPALISHAPSRFGFEFENLHILEDHYMREVEDKEWSVVTGNSVVMECTLMIQGVFPVLATLTVHDVTVADVKSMLPVEVMDKMMGL